MATRMVACPTCGAKLPNAALIPHLYGCRDVQTWLRAAELGLPDDVTELFCARPHAEDKVAAVAPEPLPEAGTARQLEAGLSDEDSAALAARTTSDHVLAIVPREDPGSGLNADNTGPRYVVRHDDAHLVHTHGPEAGGVRLWLGSEAAARSPEWLRAHRIVAVVNCATDSTPLAARTREAAGVAHYQQLHIHDVSTGVYAAMIAEGAGSVAKAVAFAASQADAGGAQAAGPPGVLVHCVAGVSRSSSCVIAYLISRLHGAPRPLGLREAAVQVKRARSVIYPNLAFFRALLELERAQAASEAEAATGTCGAGAAAAASPAAARELFPEEALQLHKACPLTAVRLKRLEEG